MLFLHSALCVPLDYDSLSAKIMFINPWVDHTWHIPPLNSRPELSMANLHNQGFWRELLRTSTLLRKLLPTAALQLSSNKLMSPKCTGTLQKPDLPSTPKHPDHWTCDTLPQEVSYVVNMRTKLYWAQFPDFSLFTGCSFVTHNHLISWYFNLGIQVLNEMKSPYALEKLEGTWRIDIPIQGTELPTSLAGITAYKHFLLPCNHHLVDTGNCFHNQGLCVKLTAHCWGHWLPKASEMLRCHLFSFNCKGTSSFFLLPPKNQAKSQCGTGYTASPSAVAALKVGLIFRETQKIK